MHFAFCILHFSSPPFLEKFLHRSVDNRDVGDGVLLEIADVIFCSRREDLDGKNLLGTSCQDHADRPRARIEIKDNRILAPYHIARDAIEHFRSGCIGLEKTPRTDLKIQVKKPLSDDRRAGYMLVLSVDRISLACIVQEISGGDGKRFDELFEGFSEFCLLISTEVGRIHRNDDHGLSCFFAPSDDQMPPKSDIRLHIIRRQAIRAGEYIKSTEDLIHGVISEHTKRAVDDAVELPCLMKSESVGIVFAFTGRDVFPPAEFYFIAVSVYLRRSLDGMPCRSLDDSRRMDKDFSDLCFFYLQLFFVRYREPSATAVDLEMLGQGCFEG